MAGKHIRLDSRFNVISAFWVPDATDEAVYTGTLTVDEDGITFTTAPKYDRRLSGTPRFRLDGSEPARRPALQGFTEDGLCTLCQLVEIGHPGRTDFELDQSITATNYRASVCVTGMHLGGLDDRCIKSAHYTFAGLSEWLPGAISEARENDCVVIKVPIDARDYLALSLRESRIQVSLKVFSELTNSEKDGARRSRSVAYVDIETPSTECLSWYLDIGNRLENLFSLLTGTSLALETMFVYRGKERGHVIAKRNNYAKRFDLLECVRCTPSQLANSISIWLSESQGFRAVENLALGVVRKGKLFIQTEFLSLAQALEGFHRVTAPSTAVDKNMTRQIRKKIAALLKTENVDADIAKRICTSMSHANDPTFALRLTELCSRISSSLLSRMGIFPEQFVSDVVTNRNYYTHAGSSARIGKKSKPISETQLFFLNQKMRALLRGVILLHLGIPEDQISELIVREATRWR